jgi:hypothetical protein
MIVILRRYYTAISLKKDEVERIFQEHRIQTIFNSGGIWGLTPSKPT